jgi:hexosaminidase
MKQNHLPKKLLIYSLLLIFTLQTINTKAQAPAQANDPYLGIIPAPASVKKVPGTFVFSQLTKIKADVPKGKFAALLHDFLLNNRHFNNRISKYNPRLKSAKGTTLTITSVGANKLPKEGLQAYYHSAPYNYCR